MYLELKFSFAEVFKNSWKEFTAAVKDDGEAHDPNETATQHEGQQQRGGKRVKAELRGGDKHQDSNQNQDVGGGTPHKNEKAKTLNSINTKALKHRTNFLNTVSSAYEIGKAIEENEGWLWAANPQHQGELKRLVDELRGSLDEFGRMFLTEDPATIKKRHKAEYLVVGLDKFISVDYKPTLDFITKLRKRHGA